jgi:hypothetical protein
MADKKFARSFSSDRQLIGLAKTMDLEAIVREPEAILKTSHAARN